MTLEPKDQPPQGPSGEGIPPNSQRELVLAKWSTRFWAWLIDLIIVTVAFEIIFAIAYPPLTFIQGINSSSNFMGSSANSQPWIGGAKYAIQSLMFFAYWIYFESSTGQSIGKRLLKIRTTDLTGNKADLRSVAIQSFGKAFLLPVDVILGWIFTNDKRQRLLSKAANTIVIRYEDSGGEERIRYKKD